MTNGAKRNLAETVLKGLGAIADRPTKKDGSLDTDAFNKLPEVKKATKRLKEAGINRNWLWDNGFMAAGMLLTFEK